MTVVEYIRRKNKILEELTGIILVPEDQIEEVIQLRLEDNSDAGICPYCILYNSEDTEFGERQCTGCPMAIKNNKCSDPLTANTYDKVREKLNNATLLSIPAIQELVKEYNSQFK